MKKPVTIPSSARGAVTAWLLLLAVVLGAGVPEAVAGKPRVPRQSRRSETREIEGLEEQWRSAVVSGDATVMDKLLSEDFLAISARGTLSDKQQYLHRIATHATQFTAFNLMDIKVRVQLASAVAVSQANIAGMLEGRPIEGTFRYTKVYARGAGGLWRITNFEATRVSGAAGNSPDMDHGLPIGDTELRRDR